MAIAHTLLRIRRGVEAGDKAAHFEMTQPTEDDYYAVLEEMPAITF